jgi:hypothetical protein
MTFSRHYASSWLEGIGERESRGTSKRHIILKERRLILLEDSQASPARPSARDSVKMKILRWI